MWMNGRPGSDVEFLFLAHSVEFQQRLKMLPTRKTSHPTDFRVRDIGQAISVCVAKDRSLGMGRLELSAHEEEFTLGTDERL